MNPGNNPGQYENIQHLTNTAARVSVYGIRSSAYHWHYDYELIVVLRGKIEAQYGLYGPEAQKLSAGDMILINSKGIHGFRGVELNNVCLCIQFSPALLEPVPAGMNYLFFLNSSSQKYPSKIPYSQYIKTAAMVGLSHRGTDKGSALRENAWLQMLIADLLDGAQYELRSASPNNEKNAELVMEISGFVDRNLSAENLPAAVCREFGLSEKGVYRILKDTVGQTLKELIDTARIEKACTLLQDVRMPLQIVSDLCGYSGEATFYRRFRSAMGITPGEYRKGAEANAVSNDIQDYLYFNDCGVDELLHQWADIDVEGWQS
ncbi:MAG: helix-turn-helix domain-containing protein [Lachnospiraceae bacterium]|nr:helix-turn-helix domain-containing protein [Lachnospiraceae bacterium]